MGFSPLGLCRIGRLCGNRADSAMGLVMFSGDGYWNWVGGGRRSGRERESGNWAYS